MDIVMDIVKIDYDTEEIVEEIEGNKPFEIKSDEEASWAFKKLRNIELKMKNIHQLAEHEISIIENWKEKEIAKHENSKAYFEGLITKYVSDNLKNDPKFKVSTPWGQAKMKKQRDGVEYEDAKVLEWLKVNDRTDLIRVKEEIKKSDLKKAFKECAGHLITEYGEIVDGVKIVERPDVIDIKVSEYN